MIRSLRAFSLHTPSLSVGLVFMTLNVMFSSWLARIPEVQARLNLDEFQLGLALLGTSCGAVLSTPLSGQLLKRLPTGQATLISAAVFCGLIILPAYVNNFWLLFFALFFVGLSNGFMNVSMNSAAYSVEKSYRIGIMATCHGMFSLGGMIGAGSSGIIASLGVPLNVHLTGLGLLMLGLMMAIRPALLHIPSTEQEQEQKSFGIPSKALLVVAFIGFCIMVGEGAIADWSAVYIRNTLGGSPLIAGLGLATFSFAMAFTRFSGDGFRVWLGTKRLLISGALLGALGLFLTVVLPNPYVALFGFFLAGVGFANVVPILFGAAARIPGVSPSSGIATVATAGIIGFLLGPPVIGFIATAFSLTFSFALIAALAFVAGGIALRAKV